MLGMAALLQQTAGCLQASSVWSQLLPAGEPSQLTSVSLYCQAQPPTKNLSRNPAHTPTVSPDCCHTQPADLPRRLIPASAGSLTQQPTAAVDLSP